MFEAALSMAIFASILTVGLTNYALKKDNDEIHQTSKKLETLKDAIDDFVSANHYLPCPANPTLKSDDTSYMMEARDPVTGYCTTTGLETLDSDEAATYGDGHFDVEINDDYLKGSPPCRTLGLNSNCATDKNGNRLSYVMSHHLAKADPCTKYLKDDYSLEEIPYTLKILSNASPSDTLAQNYTTYGKYSDTDDEPVYALVYHGDDGIGAYNTDGTKNAPREVSTGVFLDNYFNNLNHATNSPAKINYLLSPEQPLETPSAVVEENIKPITFGDVVVWSRPSGINYKICSHCRSCNAEYKSDIEKTDTFVDCPTTLGLSCKCTANEDCDQGAGECCNVSTGLCSVAACSGHTVACAGGGASCTGGEIPYDGPSTVYDCGDVEADVGIAENTVLVSGMTAEGYPYEIRYGGVTEAPNGDCVPKLIGYYDDICKEITTPSGLSGYAGNDTISIETVDAAPYSIDPTGQVFGATFTASDTAPSASYASTSSGAIGTVTFTTRYKQDGEEKSFAHVSEVSNSDIYRGYEFDAITATRTCPIDETQFTVECDTSCTQPGAQINYSGPPTVSDCADVDDYTDVAPGDLIYSGTNEDGIEWEVKYMGARAEGESCYPELRWYPTNLCDYITLSPTAVDTSSIYKTTYMPEDYGEIRSDFNMTLDYTAPDLTYDFSAGGGSFGETIAVSGSDTFRNTTLEGLEGNVVCPTDTLECSSHDHCSGGEKCCAGTCTSDTTGCSCTTDDDCAGGQTCNGSNVCSTAYSSSTSGAGSYFVACDPDGCDNSDALLTYSGPRFVSDPSQLVADFEPGSTLASGKTSDNVEWRYVYGGATTDEYGDVYPNIFSIITRPCNMITQKPSSILSSYTDGYSYINGDTYTFKNTSQYSTSFVNELRFGAKEPYFSTKYSYSSSGLDANYAMNTFVAQDHFNENYISSKSPLTMSVNTADSYRMSKISNIAPYDCPTDDGSPATALSVACSSGGCTGGTIPYTGGATVYDCAGLEDVGVEVGDTLFSGITGEGVGYNIIYDGSNIDGTTCRPQLKIIFSRLCNLLVSSYETMHGLRDINTSNSHALTYGSTLELNSVSVDWVDLGSGNGRIDYTVNFEQDNVAKQVTGSSNTTTTGGATTIEGDSPFSMYSYCPDDISVSAAPSPSFEVQCHLGGCNRAQGTIRYTGSTTVSDCDDVQAYVNRAVGYVISSGSGDAGSWSLTYDGIRTTYDTPGDEGSGGKCWPRFKLTYDNFCDIITVDDDSGGTLEGFSSATGYAFYEDHASSIKFGTQISGTTASASYDAGGSSGSGSVSLEPYVSNYITYLGDWGDTLYSYLMFPSAPNGEFTLSGTDTHKKYKMHFSSDTDHEPILTCPIDTQEEYTISGNIVWEHNDTSPVQQVTVALSGAETQSTTTDSSGNYSFTVHTPGSYTITPTKNINRMNGVTAADATAIQQHNTGSAYITDQYKLRAADVNRSNNISSVDSATINGCIANNPSSLATFNKYWRFVPSNLTLTCSSPCYSFTALTETITTTITTSDSTGNNFIGIKVGDVNGSANPAN